MWLGSKERQHVSGTLKMSRTQMGRETGKGIPGYGNIRNMCGVVKPQGEFEEM